MSNLTYDEVLRKKINYAVCEQFLSLFSSDVLSYEGFIVVKSYKLDKLIFGKGFNPNTSYEEMLNIYVEFTARLVISCDGNLQKSINLTKMLLAKIDHIYISTFICALIEFLIFIIKDDTIVEGTYFDNNKEKKIQLLNSILASPLKNIIALLKPLCENNNNTGRLSGTIDKENSIIYQKREGPEFSINFTNKCPCACIFCVRDFSTGWRNSGNLYLAKEPTVSDIKNAILEELEHRTDTVELIKFCGYGEPLVRSNVIIEVAEFIKSLVPDVKIQINTAGWPYYRNNKVNLEKYREVGITSFSISVNAPNKELYDKITRPGVYDRDELAFEDTLKFIKECINHQFETKCTLVKFGIKEEDIIATEKNINDLGAVFIVREYIGDIQKDRTDKKVTEIEAKVLDVDRDMLLQKFRNKHINLKFADITKLLVYDIPSEEYKREAILQLIKNNPPELRKYFGILAIIKDAIEQNVTLRDSKTFLRIRFENGVTSIILKKPEIFTENLKFESEYFYPLADINEGTMIMNLIGLDKIREQEKFRESYSYYGITFNIDTWPGLPTYLEVEAIDEIDIYNGLKILEIDFKDAIGLHAETLFISNNLDSSRLFFSDKDKEIFKKPYV